MKHYSKILTWSIIIALGGFLFGFDTAVISGVEKVIKETFSLTVVEHGLIVSAALIGTIIGASLASKPIDRYGRRPFLLLVALIYFVASIGSALSFNAISLFIFRLIGGLGVGASSVIAPMYISELSPAEIRGRMTSFFQINVIAGILSAYLSNYLLYDLIATESWRLMLGVQCIPALLYFVLLFFVPESPRFLLMQNKVEQATSILQKIHEGSVEDIVYAIQKQLSEKESDKKQLFIPANKKAIIVAFLVAMFNQFSGINAILYYAPRIFELSGFSSGDSLQQSIIVGFINLIFTLIGSLLIDKVGRRKLLISKHSVNHVFSSPTSIINFTSKKPSYDDTRRSGRDNELLQRAQNDL